MNVTKMIDFEEGGWKSKPYLCSEGFATIGVGDRIGAKDQQLSDFKYISTCQAAAYAQLEFKIAGLTANLSNTLEFFDDLNEVRQAVLISMSYQIGFTGLMKFKRMLAAMQTGCWNDAAHEGLDSKWHEQTPQRAERQMVTLLKGDWSEYEVA